MKKISLFIGAFFMVGFLYFASPHETYAQTSGTCGDWGRSCTPGCGLPESGDLATNCFNSGECTSVACPQDSCRIENLPGGGEQAICTDNICEPASTVVNVNYDLNNNGVNDPVCTTFEECADASCTYMYGYQICTGESPVSGAEVTAQFNAETETVITDTEGKAIFPAFIGNSASWGNTWGGTIFTYSVNSIPGYTSVPSTIDFQQPACGTATTDFVLQNNAYTGLGPQNGTHTGRVFIDNDSDGAFLPNEPFTDSNGNGVWDRTCTAFFIVCWSWSEEPYTDQNGNGTYDNGPDALYTARPYIYLTNPNNGQSVSSRANSSGVYSIQRFNADYTLRINAPSGYSLTTPNPVSIVAGNPQVVNFGIIGNAPTLCPTGDLTASPTTIYAGDTSNLSLINCVTPTPGGSSPGVTIDWQPPSCGTMPNPNSGILTNIYTAPPVIGVCAPQVCRVETQVTDGTQTSIFSKDITVRNRDVIQGNVYQDINNDGCTTLSAYASAGVQLWEGNSNTLITTDTTNASGQYQLINEQSVCSNLNIILPGETIKRTRVNGGAWTPETGSDYSLTLTSNPQTVDFCVGTVTPWFQVTTGDVRFYDLINPIPAGIFAALGNGSGNFPGIYISSDYFDTNGRNVSTQNWKVESEYNYNSNFKSGKGSMAFSFYSAKAKDLGVTITNIPDTLDLTVRPSGVYRLPDGAVISNNISLGLNQHYIVLVDGNVTINGEVSAPAGGNRLFILAAKGNITIGPNVGTSTLTSTTSNLDGFYSAQGNIILQSKANCAASTLDERLNVGGALITNALNPFATNGTGTIINNRTLCASDTLYPTLYVASRVDFLTQMTDFYKTVYKAFREIEP